jgi:Tfp pilus assembly protein PilX
MQTRRLTQILTDERGAALPLALIAMVMLTTLIVAFSVLATTEPLIANNQLTVAQARSVAESGVERAIWALNNDTHANGLPAVLTSPAPAPYDGSAPVNVTLGATTLGVYRVTVTNGAAVNERDIVALSSLPSEASPRAKQRIQVTVIKLKIPDPPAALSVRGELQMGGNTNISALSDTSCGAKSGTYTTGTTSTGGSADVWGADGNSTRNQSTDILQGQPTASFDQYLLSDSDMASLKAYAKQQGTYYQGAVTFNSGNQMPNGVIFVDSVSGSPVTASSDPSDMANVTIHGNAPASADGIFKGWLIVNGTLAISGNFQMWGFGYVQNDFTYTGTGTGQIVGAMLSRNIQDASSTTIDTNTGGNASIVYDCAKARGAGFVPLTYSVKPGSYKELSD